MRIQTLLRALVLAAVVVCASAGRDFYKVLGIDRGADDRTLKKAYRQMALKHHPDKGGSEEKFGEVAVAYDVLSDADKRRVYDTYGEDGVKQHEQGGHPSQGGGQGGFGGGGFPGGFPGGGGSQFTFQFGGGGGGAGRGGQQRDPFDIFAQMFGEESSGGSRGGGGQRRGRPQNNNNAGAPRSTENLFAKDSGVKSLRRNKFPGSDAKHVWLVMFYAPWCQHCKKFTPTFERLALELDGLVKVGAVNCELEKQLCGVEGVSSFPVIRLKKGSVTVTYDGERDLSSLKTWTLDQLPVNINNVRKPEQLEAFLTEKVKGNRCGREAVCVLFFSDTTETPAWYKVLANTLKGRFFFCEVRARNEGLALQLMDAPRFPSLVLACGGDASRTVEYAGELLHTMMNPTDVAKWVESWKHGDGAGACLGVVSTPKTGTKLDKNLAYETMRVSKLKAVLAANGIPCISCAEKTDFTAAIRDAIVERTEL